MPTSAHIRERVRVGGGLIVGALAGMAAGSMFDRPSLHLIFTGADGLHYSPLQIEAIFACGVIGLACGFPASLLARRLSAMWLSVMACVGSTLGFLLLWSSTINNGWYRDKAALICLYNFLAGHSLAYLYHTSLWINMKNMDDQVGMASAVVHGPFVCGAVLLWIIVHYMRILFVVQLGVCAIASLCGILLLRLQTRRSIIVTNNSIVGRIREQRTSANVRALTTPAYEYAPSDTESIDDAGSDTESLPPPSDRHPLATAEHRRRLHLYALSWRVQRPLWAFALAAATSLPMSTEAYAAPRLRLSVSAIVALLTGFYTDAFGSVPRGNLLTIALAARACILAVAVYDRSVTGIDTLLDVSGGAIAAVVWVLVPVVVREKFGSSRLITLWSIMLCVFVGVCTAETAISLALFDNEASPAAAVCIGGVQCHQLISMFRLALTACAIIWSCGLAAYY